MIIKDGDTEKLYFSVEVQSNNIFYSQEEELYFTVEVKNTNFYSDRDGLYFEIQTQT